MSDTTYRVPDSLIIAFNQTLNGKKKLKQHLTTNKLSPGEHYAGPFEFITYTDDNGKTDSMVIVMGFLDDELQSIVDKIWHLPFGRIVKQGKVYRNKILEAQVLKSHKECKYAPVIEAPPTVKELIKN